MPMSPSRCVIAGSGIAGVSAAIAIRKALPDAGIVLVSREACLPYYRLSLTRYLSGNMTSEDLPLHPEAWYRDNRIELVRGSSAQTLSVKDLTCTLGSGRVEHWDRFIFATGSFPCMPSIPGTGLTGVTMLRTMDDADRILSWVQPGRPCICIGGGTLGLETAGAMARRGMDVTIVESQPWLMPRHLNARASACLEHHLSLAGIRLRTGSITMEIIGGERVEQIRLKDGSVLPADLVILMTGTQPDTTLARQAGITCNRGIVVNDRMETTVPGVYAAGDVAEHAGRVYGLWNASMRQGTVAGLNASGAETAFAGLAPSYSLRVLDIGIMSVGTIEAPDRDHLVLDHDTGSAYHHYVLRNDRLVGCILVGDTRPAQAAKRAIESGENLGPILTGTATGLDLARHFEHS